MSQILINLHFAVSKHSFKKKKPFGHDNYAHQTMNGSILPVTFPLFRGKSSLSDPGVGNCPKRACPGGRKEGQTEKRSCEIRQLNVWPIGRHRDGELSLSVCRGVGNKLLSEKQLEISKMPGERGGDKIAFFLFVFLPSSVKGALLCLWGARGGGGGRR